MLVNQEENYSSDLQNWNTDDLIFLINTLRSKLSKKEITIQRLKEDLEASRTFNGKLQQKVRYLQAKIVDGYRAPQSVRDIVNIL
jgi:uncharacterized coiled-coil protein SlyX